MLFFLGLVPHTCFFVSNPLFLVRFLVRFVVRDVSPEGGMCRPLMVYEVQKQRGVSLRGLADPGHWTGPLGNIFEKYGAVKVGGRMAEWQNVRMAEWQNGRMAKWQYWKLAKCQNGKIGKR